MYVDDLYPMNGFESYLQECVQKYTSDTLGLKEINVHRTMIKLTKSLGLFMAFYAFSHPEEQIPHH